MTTYTVLKTSGTHADALAAIGAADISRIAPERPHPQTRVVRVKVEGGIMPLTG